MLEIEAEMLAAILVAAAVAAPDAGPAALPPEELVRLLRSARIAGMEGKIDDERSLLDGARQKFSEWPATNLARIEFLQKHARSPAELEQVKEELRPRLLAGDREIPLGLLKLMFRNPETPAADLELLRAHLAARQARFGDDPRLLQLLMQVERRSGRAAAARDACGRLLALRPDARTRRECIDLDLELERWDDALALIAVERRSNDDVILRASAIRALLGAGRWDALEAELAGGATTALLARIMSLDPLVESGFRLIDQGRAAEAERLFRRLRALAPERRDIERVVVLLFGSAEEQAALSIRGSGRAAGLFSEVLNEGAARLAAGDAEGAFARLTQATKLNPNSEVAWYNLGLAARKLKKWTDMEDAFGRALALKPGWVDALVQRAEARFQQNLFPLALEDLYAAERLQPGRKEVWGLMVECHRGMGNMPAAQKAYDHYRSLP